jgi:histidinol-phosphate aminotransferase
MKSIGNYVVPWVRDAEPYSDRHMDFAWGHPDVLRMMSNENPLPPSQAVLDAILDAARQGNLYPGSGPRLRQKLGEASGLAAENVILGNGSTDIINILINTFVAPGEEVIIPVPTFSMYEARARACGAVPILVPLRADFSWDIDAILAAVNDKTKLTFICTPNNPTGNEIPLDELERILALGIPTVIDEAYYELETEPHTLAYLVKEHPHVIISRTLSKAYGLAGLRVGYALADPRVIDYMMRVRIPWNVSLISLAAALAGIEDEENLQHKREVTIAGREHLRDEIDKIPGLKAFDSEGNFVLIDASALGKPSSEIVEAMIERGVFIRPMSPHHMKPGFVRITVGTPEQNDFFLEQFRAYVAQIRGES